MYELQYGNRAAWTQYSLFINLDHAIQRAVVAGQRLGWEHVRVVTDDGSVVFQASRDAIDVLRLAPMVRDA